MVVVVAAVVVVALARVCVWRCVCFKSVGLRHHHRHHRPPPPAISKVAPAMFRCPLAAHFNLDDAECSSVCDANRWVCVWVNW